jgi:enoyl-CoA hydratase
MTDREPLLIERDGGVLTLTNNDAPMNRMTFEYMDALEQAVNDAAADPGVRALVFTASDTHNFSVGMDLKQLLGGAEARGGFEAVLDQRLRSNVVRSGPVIHAPSSPNKEPGKSIPPNAGT